MYILYTYVYMYMYILVCQERSISNRLCMLPIVPKPSLKALPELDLRLSISLSLSICLYVCLSVCDSRCIYVYRSIFVGVWTKLNTDELRFRQGTVVPYSQAIPLKRRRHRRALRAPTYAAETETNNDQSTAVERT